MFSHPQARITQPVKPETEEHRYQQVPLIDIGVGSAPTENTGTEYLQKWVPVSVPKNLYRYQKR
ncbi:hypothetical protein HanRHA438_Chr05g0220421 [Helianthus annuus]|nr:hypothetical protein HanRHA438_Chr05g0220421 [Helianthus annuus]